MSEEKRTWSGAREIAKRVTPYFVLKHFTVETVGSLRRTGSTLGQLLSARKRFANENITSDLRDPKEKFEELYARNGWSPDELTTHLGRTRVTKFLLLALAALMIPTMGFTLVYIPWWVATLLLPSCLFALVFLTAQALRHAWWCWQITNRSLISIRAFIGSKDFWSYLFF